jgi:tryptophan synthase alpha chain
MNRVQKAFQNRKIFIPFLVAGYPDYETFLEMVVLLADEGAGLIEIGIPFSDPVADGKVIQAISQKTLDAGMTIEKAFELVESIRKRTNVPLVFMIYYNILLNMGLDSFVKRAEAVGLDGVIVPDLLLEESRDLQKVAKGRLALTFFLSLTTPEERIVPIAKKTTGFLYYVSRMGVTGVGGLDTSQIKERLRLVKNLTNCPLALGFGISQPKEAKDFYPNVDGLIMGSALLQKIDELRDKDDFYEQIRKFVKLFLP